MKTSYINIFRIAFTLFIFCYAILANYTYIIGGFNSPNDGIEFVVMIWAIAIYVGAISYHGYNDSYTWRSKHLSPTNICIGASIVSAIGSIGSLILISQLAFFILFLLSSLMVIISLVLINSEFGEDAIRISVKEEQDYLMSFMANNLAVKFCDILQEWLTDDELELVVARNDARVDKNDGVCHSHDFCDANMAMDEAWSSMFQNDVDTTSDADLDLWNAAWDLAKFKNFNTNK